MVIHPRCASVFSMLILLFIAVASLASPDETNSNVAGTIHNFVIEARATHDDAERAKRVSDLSAYVAGLGRGKIGGIDLASVEEIASLLDDNYNGVKHYAAVTLGNIGPGAKSAVPALEKAIVVMEQKEDAAIVKPSMPSALELYVALQKIDGRPLPDKYMPKK